MDNRIEFDRPFFRVGVVAALTAVAFSVLADPAEAKPNTRCTMAVTWLNHVSREIGFARAAGETDQVIYWQSQYAPAKVDAASACGW